ncbi:MAG: CoA transferase, partial [Dehalococcoidia bacterium]|nr:CoA transferase [Dehalococcoidia bacterium]
MGGLPLEGIRVTTLTVVWAGPFAEMLLADWGAEVIRAENLQYFSPSTRGPMARPPEIAVRGALTRHSYMNDEAGERPWNRAVLFNYHARNTLSCTMDVTQQKGKEIFKQLIAKSDVFIENNSGGAVDRLGFGYEALSTVNPRLIMVSMPGYGCYGPYKSYLGFGKHLEATGGHTLLRGYPDLDPGTNTDVYHADACSGAKAALAVMMALRHRRRTGKGQFIDLAQVESAICHQAAAVLDYTMNGHVRSTTGNRHPSAAPCGAYRCIGEDEWVAITVGDSDWAGFCRALGLSNGRTDWTEDARFSTAIGRWQNQDELDRLVEHWTSQRTNYEVMYALQKEGVAAGPVISNKDAWDDPHLIERGQFAELYQEDCGAYSTPTFPWRAKNTPNSIRSSAVLLGEHNEYVYKKLL